MDSLNNRSLFEVLSDRSGFTLIELLVAITIFTTVAAVATTVTFQILGLQRKWREDVVAIRDVRASQSAFAGDALNTVTTTLTDGAATTSTVALHWTGLDSVFHTAQYSLTGTTTPFQLVRTYDGLSKEMAGRVESVGFRLSGKILYFDMVGQGAGTSTRSSTLQTYLRNAP